MCIRDRPRGGRGEAGAGPPAGAALRQGDGARGLPAGGVAPVSYTHLRAHETVLDLVCRLLLEKKKKNKS